MQQEPRQEIHFGKVVWVNPTTELMREDECLCLNCKNLKPGEPDHCAIASKFYTICVAENVALAVTRCPVFQLRET